MLPVVLVLLLVLVLGCSSSMPLYRMDGLPGPLWGNPTPLHKQQPAARGEQPAASKPKTPTS